MGDANFNYLISLRIVDSWIILTDESGANLSRSVLLRCTLGLLQQVKKHIGSRCVNQSGIRYYLSLGDHRIVDKYLITRPIAEFEVRSIFVDWFWYLHRNIPDAWQMVLLRPFWSAMRSYQGHLIARLLKHVQQLCTRASLLTLYNWMLRGTIRKVWTLFNATGVVIAFTFIL